MKFQFNIGPQKRESLLIAQTVFNPAIHESCKLTTARPGQLVHVSFDFLAIPAIVEAFNLYRDQYGWSLSYLDVRSSFSYTIGNYLEL